jgi:hypothetical protein
MDIWNQITARFATGPDLLGFEATATPAADEWLAAFTTYFLRHPEAKHGVRALMSGLRFYTPAFVAEVTALPAVELRQPPLPGRIPNAIYTATRSIIASVYQERISRQAERQAVQAAFAQAMPGLIGQYTQFDPYRR